MFPLIFNFKFPILFQLRVYRSTRKVPKELDGILKVETFNKARDYGLDNEKFSLAKGVIFDIIIQSLEIFFGLLPFLWLKAESLTGCLGLDSSNEIIVSCVFIVITNCFNLLKEIPVKIYKIFILEEKHGFNKQTPRFFVMDQIKSFVVGQIIFIPIAAAIVWIVKRGGDFFFLYLWVFTGLVAFLLLTIYPSLIAPLFDKYRPLEEGPLRESIESLASQLKFPLKKLYVVEGSRRSAHSNAYFYGLFGSKRIVLFDTLLLNKGKADPMELPEEDRGKGCTDSEVLAVLGHELGHWKLGHIIKNIIIMQVHLFLMFLVFGYLFKYEPFYRALGFPAGSRPVLVGLLIILSYVLAPYNAVINFGMTMLSRRFEYQADEFACKLGFCDELGKALIKLHIDNLGFPVYDWLYSTWSHSHPTLLQRLDRLKRNKKDK